MVVGVSSGKDTMLSEDAEADEWYLVVLGCGSSASVPKLSCLLRDSRSCICSRSFVDTRNKRLNPCILLSRQFVDAKPDEFYNILVDVGKTFREAVLASFPKHQLRHVNDLLVTHAHMDAIGGLDDIREVQVRRESVNRAKVYDQMVDATRVFMDKATTASIATLYPYMLPSPNYSREATMETTSRNSLPVTEITREGNLRLYYVAKLENWMMSHFTPFQIKEIEVTPIPLWHGVSLCLGFVFKHLTKDVQIVYFSDFRCRSLSSSGQAEDTQVPVLQEADFEELTFMEDVQTTLAILKRCPITHMILDGLHAEKTYISHSNVPETIKVIQSLERKNVIAQRIWLTGMSCTVDYHATNQLLQATFGSDRVQCFYDGLKLKCW